MFEPIVLVSAHRFMMVVRIDADEIYRTKAHPSFGPDSIGESANSLGWASENHGLERRGMIEDHVRRRNDKVVMLVLHVEQSLCQCTGSVIIDVRQIRDAMRPGHAFQPPRLDGLPDEISHGLGAALIALFLDDPIEQQADFRIE